MQIRAIAKDITKVKADALIVNLFEGVKRPSGATGAVDKALNGAITKLIAGGEIKGKVAETTVIHVFGQLPADRVAVLGLGPARSFDVDTARRAMGAACRALRERGVTRIATVLHGEEEKDRRIWSSGQESLAPRTDGVDLVHLFGHRLRPAKPSGRLLNRLVSRAALLLQVLDAILQMRMHLPDELSFLDGAHAQMNAEVFEILYELRDHSRAPPLCSRRGKNHGNGVREALPLAESRREGALALLRQEIVAPLLARRGTLPLGIEEPVLL